MSNFKEYTVKRFPLFAEFQRIINMFCEFEADVSTAEVFSTVADWKNNLRVEALLDGDEIVEIVIKVRPKEMDK